MSPLSRALRCCTRLLVVLLAMPESVAGARASEGYREPPPAVVELLTATPPPEPLLHAKSRRVALLFRKPVVPLERLARPYLGLAGFHFDPATGTSDTNPRIERVEVVDAGLEPGRPLVEWRPAGGAELAYVRFSPDGRFLSALAVSAGPARMVIFDVALAEERVIGAPVNPAWGDPCSWLGAQTLLCQLVPVDRGDVPTPRTEPRIVEHVGRAAPARTYSNLLDNANEDALFEYHFASELARVGIDGSIQRLAGSRGLIASVLPSPDGRDGAGPGGLDRAVGGEGVRGALDGAGPTLRR